MLEPVKIALMRLSGKIKSEEVVHAHGKTFLLARGMIIKLRADKPSVIQFIFNGTVVNEAELTTNAWKDLYAQEISVSFPDLHVLLEVRGETEI
jgi:hypothetical protein